MTAAHGWAGKIVFVDLDSGRVRQEATADYRDFLGGRGINQRLLFEHCPNGLDALDPAAPVILGAGVMVGSAVPTASRLAVEHKNALNGALGSGNLGGDFAAQMKFCGIDHLVISGRAQRPVCLALGQDRVRIEDASWLWGLDTWQTNQALKEMAGDPELATLCIGPAGENLVRFACLIGDQGRAAGYGGGGAVLGSKNLKAVTAGGGLLKIEPAQPQRFAQTLESFKQKVFDKARTVAKHREMGTLGIYMLPGQKRPHGVNNLSRDFLSERDLAALSRAEFDRFLIQRRGCFNCPVECGGLFKVRGLETEGIQANSLRALGTNLGVLDAQEILYNHALVNRLGLDVDQTSTAVAWAMECFEKGLLSSKEADGLSLTFGNGPAAAGLIKKIAAREGLGDLLAEGVEAAAAQWDRGSRNLTAVVKGTGVMEAGMRTHRAWALGVMTSTKGAGHLRGSSGLEFQGLAPELSAEFGVGDVSDPTSYQNKAALVVWQERYKTVVDVMGICALTSMWMDRTLFSPPHLAELFSSLTGLEKESAELMELGERVQTLERAFNWLHAGYQRKHDRAPRRFSEIAVDQGEYCGERIDPAAWEQMLDEYYALHHWDPVTGNPRRRRLQGLDLDFAARALGEAGLL